MTQTVAVSRLGWHDAAAAIEIPHVRGVPVITGNGEHVIERSWPNRLGMLEHRGDRIVWHSELAPVPEREADERIGVAIIAAAEFHERRHWFSKLLKRSTQHRGIMLAAPPEALAAILLTPAGVGHTAIPGHVEDTIEDVPLRLGEFPGGIQLRLTDRAWQHRQEYASVIETIAMESS